jgi:hypothetical protein
MQTGPNNTSKKNKNHHGQLGFMPEKQKWFNVQGVTNIIYQINKLKGKAA